MGGALRAVRHHPRPGAGADDWRAARDRLPVPFTTFHRDDQPAAIRAAAGGAAPVVLAETADDMLVVAGPDELAACAGPPEQLVAAIESALTTLDLSWPVHDG